MGIVSKGCRFTLLEIRDCFVGIKQKRLLAMTGWGSHCFSLIIRSFAMTGWGSHCERLKGARQSPLWFFMSLRKASKGILLPLRNSRLLRRHETKTPPRNDGLEKRLPRRAAPSFAMMGCRRLLRRHKVAPSR